MPQTTKTPFDTWDKPIWSKTETARAIGITTRTLDRWRRLRVAPPCVRVGGTIRWRRDAVLEWMQRREAAA